MIESPLIQEIVEEACAKAEANARVEKARKVALRFLTAHFDPVPSDIAAALQNIQDEAKLDELIDLAASCNSLVEFRSQLGVG